jgi:hypothetical protein
VNDTTPFYRYRAFGLTLDSELCLPELMASDPPTDPPGIVLRFEPLKVPESVKEHGRYTRIHESLAYLYWDGVGVFCIREGREILIDPLPSVGEDPLRLLTLGPVFAVLLHQRGLWVLHGSAVRFPFDGGEAAVAFLGHSGSGKSTTASALQSRGYGFITDDLAVLQSGENSSVILILPGYPRCKLRPEALEPLGLKPETLPLVSPDQRRSQTMGDFETAPLPLRHIILLSAGSSVEMDSLSRKEAVVELSRYVYLAPFLTSEETAQNLGTLASVSRHVSVHRFTRPLNTQHIPMLMDEIETFLLKGAR